MTFWWFPFKLANQNVTTGGGGVDWRHAGLLTINTPASHSPCILIGQMQQGANTKLLKQKLQTPNVH